MPMSEDAPKRLDEIVNKILRAAKEANLPPEDMQAVNDVVEDWRRMGVERIYRFATFDVWNFPLYLAIASSIHNRRELNRLVNAMKAAQ